MKNLKNRIEVIEEDLQKKEVKRQQEQKVQRVVTEAKNIKIEKLPYSYAALKQFIDPETMSVHYNKHYKGYVDKLNGALKDDEDLTLEEIVKTIDSFNKFIRNNAGGAYNHQLFWKMLTPKTTKPGPITLKKINQSFSYDMDYGGGGGWVIVGGDESPEELPKIENKIETPCLSIIVNKIINVNFLFIS